MKKSRSEHFGLKNYVRAVDAMETSSVTSWADPKFVSAHQVAAFLSVLDEKDCTLFIFAWLLLTTRIHPDRLEKLVQTNSSYVEPGTDIHNNKWTGGMSYFVLGNSNDKENYPEDRDRMSYQCPHLVAGFLATTKVNENGKDQPFLGLTSKLYYRADQFRKKHGGLTPSAHALAMSFDAWVMPHMKDDLLARILGGSMIDGHGPSSSYYNVDSIDVNTNGQFAQKKIAQIIKQQSSASPELIKALGHIGFRKSDDSVKIGSRKSVDPDSLEYLVDALHAAADRALISARLTTGIQQVIAYARVVNLLYALYFLMQRYSQLLRTVANRMQSFTHPELDITMTADKNSANLLRSRVNFRVDAERAQRAYCDQAIATLDKLARKAGMVINCDERLLEENHAIVVDVAVKPKDGIPRLRLSRYTQKRFKKQLRKEGIANNGADNANRHTIASLLRGKVPQPLLDLALNHTGPGRNPFYDYSFMSLLPEDRRKFIRKLEAIFPFKTLDLPLHPGQTTKTVIDLKQVLKKAKPFKSGKPVKNGSKKKPQKDVLPDKPCQITGLPAIIKAYDYLWSEGFAELSPGLFRIAFILALCLEQGAGEKYLDKLLPLLQWEDRKDTDDLRVPFQRGEEDSPHTRLFLTDDASLLLEAIEHHEKPQPGDFLFAPNERDPLQRGDAITAQLEGEWQILKQSFKTFAPAYSLPSFKVMLDVARVHPILEIGLEPYLSTLLSDAELTTDHGARLNEPLFNFEAARPGTHHAWIKNIGKVFRKIVSRVKPERTDFQVEAIAIRHDLIEGLEAITAKSQAVKKTLKSVEATREVHALIDDLLTRADKLNPEGTSALHLVLDFIRSRYRYDRCSKNPVTKTVSNIFGEAFSERLFAIPEARDLTELTADQLNDYITGWVDDKKIDYGTAENVANCLRRVLAFGNEGVCLSHLDIPSFGGSSAFNGTRRADLISPRHFDNHLRPFMDSDQREDHEHAVTLILAGPGGLRESEIRNLKIDDIITTETICWIYIRYGKSRMTRRAIPLHLFAQPGDVAFLHQYRTNRFEEFDHSDEDTGLKQIAFLGPEQDPRAYERHECSDKVIAKLKSAFGPDADLHLLRHCFCSWLMVRLAALRYPHITRDLKSRGHWMFQEEAQKNLLAFFTLGASDKLSRFDINALMHIARVMGHSSLRTTFQYYVQTFSILQREAVQRANRHICQRRRIDGKTCTVMFHGILGSHRTYALLKDKTVSGLLAYLVRRKQTKVA